MIVVIFDMNLILNLSIRKLDEGKLIVYELIERK